MAQDVTQTSGADAGVLVREGNYGTQVIAVEPGGAEFIPLNERHGRPIQLFWTWTSPNMEFATIFVGVLAVAGFGLGFWEASLALVLGSAIGGITCLRVASIIRVASDSRRPDFGPCPPERFGTTCTSSAGLQR